MMRLPPTWPRSATTSAGTPISIARRWPFAVSPHSSSGSDGHSIECKSISTSTVSISERISRARSSSTECRGPSSTSTSQTRLMSSSTKREAVGWRGSKRWNASRLTKPKVSRPRVGASPARSRRSSTMAPEISLPCVSASSATCGPGSAATRVVNPRTPVLPSAQGAMSGTASRTSNGGAGGRVTRGPMHIASDEQPVRQAADEGVAGVELVLRDPLVWLVRLGDVAGAADDGGDVGRLVVAALGAVADFSGAVCPGDLLDHRGQFMVGRERHPRHGVAYLEAKPSGRIDCVHCRLDVRGDVGFQAFDLAHAVIAGDGAPLHDELGVLGDDVEDAAALDGADMDGGVRRVESVLERAFLGEPSRLGCHVTHRLGGGVDRVHALVGL